MRMCAGLKTPTVGVCVYVCVYGRGVGGPRCGPQQMCHLLLHHLQRLLLPPPLCPVSVLSAGLGSVIPLYAANLVLYNSIPSPQLQVLLFRPSRYTPLLYAWLLSCLVLRVLVDSGTH